MAAAPPRAGAREPSRRARLSAILTALALGVAGIAVGFALGGHSSPTAAELGQRRAHLAYVAAGLRHAAPSVRRELATTKAAWPAIAQDLPSKPSASLLARSAAATRAAEAVRTPPFIPLLDELVGPAAGIARLFRSSQLLLRDGWQHVDAALNATARAGSAARFERANSSLYVESIYQGAFDLSIIGESVEGNYRKLGGPKIFRRELTPVRVGVIAHTYSPAAKLEPHAVLRSG
ncbi:MAG: hypothetical protein ACYCUM_11795 [Solirubrobacteraceae bacterium]